MKHYKELMEIENISMNLEVLAGTARVITYGARESNMEDVEYAMHNVTDQLHNLSERLRDSFNVLFDAVREESSESSKNLTKKGRSKNGKNV